MSNQPPALLISASLRLKTGHVRASSASGGRGAAGGGTGRHGRQSRRDGRGGSRAAEVTVWRYVWSSDGANGMPGRGSGG